MFTPIQIPEHFVTNALVVAECTLKGLVTQNLVSIEGCSRVGVVIAVPGVVAHGGIYTREIRADYPLGVSTMNMKREVDARLDAWLKACNRIAESKLVLTMRANEVMPGATCRMVHALMPHLLVGGDTLYQGSVNRLGLMAAASGLADPWDEMIAGVVVDSIHAQFAMAVRAARESATREGEHFFRF